MITGEKFFEICHVYGIGTIRDDKFVLTSDELRVLDYNNHLFDATKGGLVLGNLHEQGGVGMLRMLNDNEYFFFSEMEGWEYITAPIKSKSLIRQFENINTSHPMNRRGEDLIKFNVPQKCRVIDTRTTTVACILISEYSQYIICRNATRNCMDEILKLDQML